jgi:hypothetical protein
MVPHPALLLPLSSSSTSRADGEERATTWDRIKKGEGRARIAEDLTAASEKMEIIYSEAYTSFRNVHG